MEKISRYDFIVFASRHQSEKKEKTLSIHAPGNWRRAFSRDSLTTKTSEGAREADFGGEPKKISKTSALFQKQLFEKLNENAEEYNLKEYSVTLECTHHGPLINKPCVFIEIGATETEWNDRRAGFIVAKTIKDVLETFKENPYNEIAFGIGGPHYCPNFNKIQLKSNVALSHIIPQYALPLDEEMLKEALNKTEEEIDFAVLDWRGLGNAEQRKQVTDLLDKFYVSYKKTSDIEK